MGTLAVCYVVTSQDPKTTLLRINAVFAEDFRHTVHPSNGSVESAEYRDIHDHIETIESLKPQSAGEEKGEQNLGRRPEGLTANVGEMPPAVSSSAIGEKSVEVDRRLPAADASAETLEQ